MNDELAFLPQDDAKEAIVLILEHLAEWAIKTPETFRNAILGDGFIAFNPMIGVNDDTDVVFMKTAITNAVVEGRMIDFGFIPNKVIIEESVRSREMFETGEFQHPYESWLAISRWEGGCNGYYIAPHPFFEGETLVIELYGVTIPSVGNAILIYDIVSIKVGGYGQTTISPIIMRYPSHTDTEVDIRARGANSLDPLVTMLRLLADASIPIERREAPPKLNKARAKQGKFIIPDHTVVKTTDYVATFAHSVARGSGKGGTHASPIAHWRRAHTRTLATGAVIPVRSSKVNWREAEELHRLFYKVRP